MDAAPLNAATWATAAVAGLASLAAGGLVIAAIGWLPAQPPGTIRRALRCPDCDARPRWADLLPVAGWRGPRTRCHGGQDMFGAWRVPAALATAAVLVIMAVRFGPSPVLPAFCYLGMVGVALASIDVRCQRLPDALTLPSYPVALVLLGIATLTTTGGWQHFGTALIGLAVALVLFCAQALIYPAGIGWGDVKLSGLLGLYLGWLGVGALIAGIFLSYLLALIVGIALLVTRRASIRSRLAFGPFLLVATLAVIALPARV